MKTLILLFLTLIVSSCSVVPDKHDSVFFNTVQDVDLSSSEVFFSASSSPESLSRSFNSALNDIYTQVALRSGVTIDADLTSTFMDNGSVAYASLSSTQRQSYDLFLRNVKVLSNEGSFREGIYFTELKIAVDESVISEMKRNALADKKFEDAITSPTITGVSTSRKSEPNLRQLRKLAKADALSKYAMRFSSVVSVSQELSTEVPSESLALRAATSIPPHSVLDEQCSRVDQETVCKVSVRFSESN